MAKKWMVVGAAVVLLGGAAGGGQGHQQAEAQGAGVPLPARQGPGRGPPGERPRGRRRRPRDQGRRQVRRLRPRPVADGARGRGREGAATCWPRSSPTSTRRSRSPTSSASVTRGRAAAPGRRARARDRRRRSSTQGLDRPARRCATSRSSATWPPRRCARPQMRYQIVEDHGIPISGNASSQKARVTAPMAGVVITKGVELGETVTSGVSSFNAGTVLFTVADLEVAASSGSTSTRSTSPRCTSASRCASRSTPTRRRSSPARCASSRRRPSSSRRSRSSRSRSRSTSSATSFRTGMSANVEILGEKRDKARLDPARGAPAARRQDGRLPPEGQPRARSRSPTAQGGLVGPQQVRLALGPLEGLLRRRPRPGRHRHARAGRDRRGPEGRRQVALEDPTPRRSKRTTRTIDADASSERRREIAIDATQRTAASRHDSDHRDPRPDQGLRRQRHRRARAARHRPRRSSAASSSP